MKRSRPLPVGPRSPRAAQRLSDDGEFFRAIAESASDLIIVIGSDLSVLHANSFSCRMIRMPQSKVIGRKLKELFPPDPCRRMSRNLRRVFRTGKALSAEEEFVFAGRRVWLDTRLIPQRKRAGGVHSVLVICRDVSHRHVAEEQLRQSRLALQAARDGLRKVVRSRTLQILHANAALRGEVRRRRISEDVVRSSEAKFRALYEQSPVGLELYDPRGCLLDANPACLKIFGVADLNDVRGFNLFRDPNMPRAAAMRLRAGHTYQNEFVFDFDKVRSRKLYPTTRTGRIHLGVICSPLRLDSRRISGYLVQVVDITQRKIAEEEMRNVRLKLVATREEERKLLAQELHDSLGQKLFAAGLKMASIIRRYPGDGDLSEQIGQMSSQFADIFNDIRQISRRLYPQSLETLGLVRCLRMMIDSLAQPNTRLLLRAPMGMEDARIAPAVELALFRIAQEAISNALRHARARRVTISLARSPRRLRMTIVDDGKGFRPDKMLHKGLGLISMKDRAEMVGGTLEIKSRPGRTCVDVRMSV